MFGKSKKRKTTRIDTLIGQHSEIQGDIRFTGGLHLDGTVKGNVIAENDGRSMLSLSECGKVEGEVSVPYVTINGVVIGDVHGSEHVELTSKARVTGNVYYNMVEMVAGAEVNGKLIHSPETPDSSLTVNHAEPLKTSD